MYQNPGFANKLGKTLNILISDDLKSVLDNIRTTFTKTIKLFFNVFSEFICKS